VVGQWGSQMSVSSAQRCWFLVFLSVGTAVGWWGGVGVFGVGGVCGVGGCGGLLGVACGGCRVVEGCGNGGGSLGVWRSRVFC